MNWEKSRSPARATFKNPKISLLIGKNLKVQRKTNTQKIPIWNLWRNWKNLWSYLRFTVENKIGKKTCFPLEKLKFEHIGNSVYTPERLTQEGPWIFISTIWCFTHADNTWSESTSSMQVYIQQWFHDEQGANFIVIRNNFGHVLIC